LLAPQFINNQLLPAALLVEKSSKRWRVRRNVSSIHIQLPGYKK